MDPAIALRDGRNDARVVLSLWCLRKTFFPLLWAGIAIAYVVIGDEEAIVEGIGVLSTSSEYVSFLLSPFSVVAFAFASRIAITLVSFAFAYPLTRWAVTESYGSGTKIGRIFHMLFDRVYLARSYRSLRWTWAVRQVAAERLGGGRGFEICTSVLRWLGVGLFVVLLLIVATFSGQS